jgi:serine phosphatase RsbU (regulator of sigma subunit)/tetratricopeptide (TPR) repeat protein
MKNFFNILFIGILLFWTNLSKAQLSSLGKNQNPDSLINLINADKEDTLKVVHLVYLSREISRHNIDSAKVLGEQAFELSRNIQWTKGEALANIARGWFKIVQGNYPAALKLLSSALEIGKDLKDSFLISVAFSNIGTLYHFEKDYDNAIEFFNKSLQIDKKINNKWGVARNLGVTGTTYLSLKKLDDAMLAFQKAYVITEEIGNINGSAIWLSNIAEVYRQKKHYDVALNYLNRSLVIFEKLKNYWVAAENRISIAKIYLELKQFNEAALQLYLALENAKLVKALDREKDCYETLSKVYELADSPICDSSRSIILSKEEMKNYALFFLKKSIALNEIVFSKERQVEIQKFEQAGKDTLKEAELNYEKRNRNIFFIVSIVTLIGLLVTAFLATFAQKKLKENRKFSNELAQKNKIIESKQHEITDSIQYAQRIQFAILPTKEKIKKAFQQSFILFQPKDIVSGDFYWFQEIENKKYIAACDCTGHGVPGALMSMVATDMLNDALVHTKKANEILELTNRSIKTALKQSNQQDSTRDGMDLVLCCFDIETNLLEFAGAFRPLWLLRNSDKTENSKNEFELMEYKGTKAAIGGLTEDHQPFQLNQIQLQKGDTFYLTTDGFADQFNPADKKLMTKRFKEIILSIQELSMPEQEKHLDQFITNWKKNTEQTDDILVIGVRV